MGRWRAASILEPGSGGGRSGRLQSPCLSRLEAHGGSSQWGAGCWALQGGRIGGEVVSWRVWWRGVLEWREAGLHGFWGCLWMGILAACVHGVEYVWAGVSLCACTHGVNVDWRVSGSWLHRRACSVACAGFPGVNTPRQRLALWSERLGHAPTACCCGVNMPL